MAHYAEIDENNIVKRVLVVSNDIEDGQEFLSKELNLGGTWIKTSYNTFGNVHKAGGSPLHKNYAGPGYIWDGIGFYEPKPDGEGWTLNSETYLWENPNIDITQFNKGKE